MQASISNVGEEKPVTVYQPPSVADNLNKVGDLIEKYGMWCKGDWSILRDSIEDDVRGKSERLGCAEGLLAEVLGFYEGYSTSFVGAITDDGGFQVVKAGEVLNMNHIDEDGDEFENYWVERLRETDEWKILADTVRESGLNLFAADKKVPHCHTVIVWNDDDDITEEDVLMGFRKAAIKADESA